jgi:hypothetical protein
VSRLTTGWNFGTHASWARMRAGMDSVVRDSPRLQHGVVRYVTLLRDPVRAGQPVKRPKTPSAVV